uniref:Uncharacterized protein n=1 Tax=Neobodo designis TaxID=312471 RepID=A0A7S1MNJ2_NEODS
MQAWLRARATGRVLHDVVEPRHRAAALLQLFVRHRQAVARMRRRLGRSTRLAPTVAGTRHAAGCCPRCAVVLEALATRLAAAPMLPAHAVRRYAAACCPTDTSPACRAAVFTLAPV